jgi:hypothetical protein
MRRAKLRVSDFFAALAPLRGRAPETSRRGFSDAV